ncbi:proline-rich receptor-like protein kinase PERK2 [Choloepus didactylus]|uniref:proline-rich receptor-like protein kinase PERK2 n=1 Tax=Choloepus didactylus TaxID=27675 RepID=UPI00189C6FC3|nr:proline-rich receptor-like protein kinase PERK2 [Choloepus didactylus]
MRPRTGPTALECKRLSAAASRWRPPWQDSGTPGFSLTQAFPPSARPSHSPLSACSSWFSPVGTAPLHLPPTCLHPAQRFPRQRALGGFPSQPLSENNPLSCSPFRGEPASSVQKRPRAPSPPPRQVVTPSPCTDSSFPGVLHPLSSLLLRLGPRPRSLGATGGMPQQPFVCVCTLLASISTPQTSVFGASLPPLRSRTRRTPNHPGNANAPAPPGSFSQLVFGRGCQTSCLQRTQPPAAATRPAPSRPRSPWHPAPHSG